MIIKIRSKLLVSFILVSLASAILITLMMFFYLKNTLLVEIDNKLKSQSLAIMEQIDTTLFERIENLVIWSELDIMQEMRFRDLDKRLSNFLSRLHTGYDDVYQHLYVTDQQNEIIAASDADLIYTHQSNLNAYQYVNYKDKTVAIFPLHKDDQQFYLAIPITNAFQNGALGKLYAGLDWKQIARILDTTQPISIILETSYVVLVNQEGQIIAQSSGFSKEFPNIKIIPSEWGICQTNSKAIDSHIGLLNNQEMLIAHAHSQGFRSFKGLDWCVIIIQPTNIAFAPIWTLWKAIAIFLLLTAILSIIASLVISHNIANPIICLANFTRDFMDGKNNQLPNTITSSKEINELATQFSIMINNLEKSRQETIRAAKLAVIGEMAASMAHEVRTPLGILKSSSQMLQREQGLSEVGYELTEFILEETKRLNDLISTLLECSRPRNPHFILYNFNEIIDYIISLVSTQANEKSVTILTQLTNSSPKIYCDRDQMIQVLLNLIINAIQHSPEGETITIITVVNQENTFEIQIADHGAGINDSDKTRVFEPFFTQRKNGIGLGLTVVQQIVLAHHGKIFITDNQRAGSCFHISLPINNSISNTLL